MRCELLLETRVHTLVNAHRVQHQANGEQRVHLVVLLVDLFGDKKENIWCSYKNK